MRHVSSANWVRSSGTPLGKVFVVAMGLENGAGRVRCSSDGEHISQHGTVETTETVSTELIAIVSDCTHEALVHTQRSSPTLSADK